MQTFNGRQLILLLTSLIIHLPKSQTSGLGGDSSPLSPSLQSSRLAVPNQVFEFPSAEQQPSALAAYQALAALTYHMQAQQQAFQPLEVQNFKSAPGDDTQAPAGQQQQQQHQSGPTRRPPSSSELELQSIARLLVQRFHFLLSQEELKRFTEQQDLLAKGQLLLERLNLQANLSSQQQSSLETRTLSLIQSNLSKLTSINLDELSQQQQKRKFIRVLNRVFSRVELPETLNTNKISLSRSTQPSGGGGGGGGGGASGSGAATGGVQGQHCASHIGCIAEIPNVPVMFKLKSNVSAAFTIYTRDRGGFKNGQRILYEPLMHYQLRDGAEQTMSELALQKEVLNITQSLKLAVTQHHLHNHHKRRPMGGGAPNGPAQHYGKQQVANKLLATVATSWISVNKIVQSRELPFDLAALEQSGFNASLNTRIIIGGYFAKEEEEWIDELVRQWLLLEDGNVIKVSWQDSNRGLYHSAAHNSRIIGRQLSLFLYYLNELFQIDLNKFHLVGHSLGAHIAGFVGADNEGQIARITGLDPAGPIFVDLNQLHRLDASDAKFVDVLHTNGGTITKGALGLSLPSGHVDYYCNGGSLQPGCFFSSVTMSTIMDPVERIACNHRRSYRYFTEIIKLAISERRKRASRGELNAGGGDDAAAGSGETIPIGKRFPHAFLFETNKQEDLVKLVQPELKLASQPSGRLVKPSLESDSNSNNNNNNNNNNRPPAPLTRQIEFHLMEPEFPRDQRALYFFKTRQESPFFASKQYALRLGLEQPLKRKLSLLVKINSTLVAEVELDELERSHSLVFVPNNPDTIDYGALFSGRSNKAPDLWLMWRQRSFNLLLAHHAANEIHLNAIELILLDENESLESDVDLNGSTPLARQQLGSNDYLIRYEPNISSQERQQTAQSSHAQQQTTGSLSRSDQGAGLVSLPANSQQQPQAGASFVITRNQWHKFDGRPVAIK